MDVNCPDCGVAMEQVQYGLKKGVSESQAPFVRTTTRREGLLGRLGFHEEKRVRTVVCPKCGLVRQYARLDG